MLGLIHGGVGFFKEIFGIVGVSTVNNPDADGRVGQSVFRIRKSPVDFVNLLGDQIMLLFGGVYHKNDKLVSADAADIVV